MILLLAVGVWVATVERRASPDGTRPATSPSPPITAPTPPAATPGLACLRPEECGVDSRPLWPAVPI